MINIATFKQKYSNIAHARDCWTQARQLDPLNPYVCHALANLEIRLRNFAAAEAVLEDVVNKRPTAALCVSLADLKRQCGKIHHAKEILEKGLKSCKDERSQLLLSLAWLEEYKFKNIELAAKYLDQALEQDPSNVRVYIAKSSMLLRLNMHDEARKLLRNCSRLNSTDGQHYTMWSTLEVECGNYADALNILQEGAVLFPGDHYLLQRWGAVEAKYGNTSKALELFSRSASIQSHTPTFVAWAMLEEKLGVQVRINNLLSMPFLQSYHYGTAIFSQTS